MQPDKIAMSDGAGGPQRGTKREACPVCRSPAAIQVSRSWRTYRCPKCGRFQLSEDAAERIRGATDRAPFTRNRLSAKIRDLQYRGRPQIDAAIAERLLASDELRPEARKLANAEWIVTWLSSHKGRATETLGGWASITGAEDEAAAAEYIREVSSSGLVRVVREADETVVLALTDAGWERQQRSREERPNQDLPPPWERPLTDLRLTTLAISNIKCFAENQRLSFKDQAGNFVRWSVLLGDNGVGKTTLLQLIAGLLPSVHPSSPDKIYATSFEAAGAFDYLAQAKSGRAASAYVELQFEVEEAGRALGHAACGGMAGLPFDKFLRELGAEFEAWSLRSGAGRPFNFYDGNQTYLGSLPLVAAYGAMRRPGRAESAIEVEGRPALVNLLSEDSSLRDPEDWLLSQDYASRFRSGKDSAHRFQQMKQLLIELLPDVTDVVVMPPTEEDGKPRLRFKTSAGLVSYKDLSLGYQTILSVVVDLATRFFDYYKDASDALKSPAIILIDELDLHLHPAWQQTVMQWFEQVFAGAQFVVTTHSPLVVQGSESVNLAVLVRGPRGVEILNDVDAVKSWRADQILTSQLFGLETLRPIRIDQALKERALLLSKPRLSAEEKLRLNDLNQLVHQLPTAANPEDERAFQIVRQAAAKLSS